MTTISHERSTARTRVSRPHFLRQQIVLNAPAYEQGLDRLVRGRVVANPKLESGALVYVQSATEKYASAREAASVSGGTDGRFIAATIWIHGYSP